MESYWDELLRIKRVLSANPRGMTVSDLSRQLKITRNSVAKYLDVLLSTGQIEMRKTGPAKVYFISKRIPLSALLYLHTDAILVLDEEGGVIHITDQLLELTAATRDDLKGKSLASIDIPPLNDPNIAAAFRERLDKPVTIIDLVHIAGDDERYLRVKILPIVLGDGRPGTGIVFEDVTGHVRTSRALGLERARLKAIIDSAPEAIIVVDEEGRMQMTNPAADWFYAGSAPLGQGCGTHGAFQLCYPDGAPYEYGDYPLILSAMHGKVIQGRELAVLFPDGESREVLVNTAPIIESTGRRVGAVGVFQDITGLKQAERALRESEATARALLNGPTDAASLIDRDGIILGLNEVTAKKFGRRPEELIGTCTWDLFPADVTAIRKARAAEVFATGAPVRYVDERDGYTFDNVLFPVTDAEGGVNRVAVIARDITAMREGERLYRESQERYRLLVENAPDMIAIHDGETLLFTNPAGLRMLGAERPEEVVGRPLEEIVHPDYHGMIRMRNRQLQEKPDVIPMIEERMVRRDGTVIDVEVSGHAFVCKGRTLMQVVARDVTRRKQAEKALQASEARYRLLFEQMQEGAILFEIVRDKAGNPVDYRYLDVNRFAESMLGRAKEELAGKTLLTVFPDVSDPGREIICRAARTGMPGRYELFIPMFNRHLIVVVYCPQPDQLAFVFQDVTEQKRHEALRRKACDQIQKNVEQLGVLADNIRIPLQVLMARADLADSEATAEAIRIQVRRINTIVRALDQGWVESRAIRDALRKNEE